MGIDLKLLDQEYKNAVQSNIQLAQQINFLSYTSLLTIILAELTFVSVVDLVNARTLLGVTATILLIVGFVGLLIDLQLQTIKVNRYIYTYTELSKSLAAYIEESGKTKILFKNLDPKYHPKNISIKKIWMAGKLYYFSLALMCVASALIIVRIIQTI